MPNFALTLALLISLALCACTSMQHNNTAATASPGFSPGTALLQHNDQNMSWHAIRFRMAKNEQGQPIWAMDSLLGHKLLGPALAEFHEQLPLWRFHRRAGSDRTGHQFSLIFFASETTAEQLAEWVMDDHLLTSLTDAGLLRDVIVQHHAYPNSESVAATSDAHWSEELQRQWPLFIMGASATWLGLIDETVLPPADEHESVAELLARYELANDKVTKLWREQGQHAFLHHLSAAFGYQPILFGNLIQF